MLAIIAHESIKKRWVFCTTTVSPMLLGLKYRGTSFQFDSNFHIQVDMLNLVLVPNLTISDVLVLDRSGKSALVQSFELHSWSYIRVRRSKYVKYDTSTAAFLPESGTNVDSLFFSCLEKVRNLFAMAEDLIVRIFCDFRWSSTWSSYFRWNSVRQPLHISTATFVGRVRV